MTSVDPRLDLERAPVPGYTVAHPLASSTPAILLGDEFTVGLLAGLDDMLAPIVWILDNVEAYLDPVTAPAPFLRWMAGWLGLEPIVELLPALHGRHGEALVRERRLIRSTIRQLAGAVAEGPARGPVTIVDADRTRGTAAALRETLDVVLGPVGSVRESGRTVVVRELVTVTPGSVTEPAAGAPAVAVVVDTWELPAHPEVVREAVRRVVALHVPAHVRVEIVVGVGPGGDR